VAFSEIKIVLEHDTKRKIDEMFSEFNEKAIAAASLAQVHEAVLKENHRKVAVKVQFPTLRT
jgi:predicted unusual protein kinase regulating ubiquinone biosynthesis (AarF/ABC1/UbiB family)